MKRTVSQGSTIKPRLNNKAPDDAGALKLLGEWERNQYFATIGPLSQWNL